MRRSLGSKAANSKVSRQKQTLKNTSVRMYITILGVFVNTTTDIGGPVGEKRKLEAVLSSSSNSIASEERPQKVQKIAKNITLIVENEKIVLQNEHGEVHIDHDFKTVTTRLPTENINNSETEARPKKQRKPRVKKTANKTDGAVTPTELNSDGKIDASMLKNYGTTANSSEQPVVVFIDGACTNNGTRYAKAGYGAFFGKDDRR